MGGVEEKATTISLGRRLAILGIMTIAILLVETPKSFVFLAHSKNLAAIYMLGCQALMFALPFAIARIVPVLGHFEVRWLPSKFSQWLWFLAMASVLLVCGGIAGLLLHCGDDLALNGPLSLIATDVRPITVVLFGIGFVLVAPFAEEIFWRGYVLSQLGRSVGHWGVALLLQSILFAVAHLHVEWRLLPVFFLYGMILGAWRIKFGCLLPLVIAHLALNAVALAPQFVACYDAAVTSYPKCQQIDVLTARPPDEALPKLIKFLGDPDDAVASHAIEALGRNFHSQAEPYLKDVLRSGDRRTIDRALFAIGWFHYASLIPEVRELVWSSDDAQVQLAALMSLRDLADEQGGRDIAQRHSDQKIRNAAKKWFVEE